MSSSVTPEVKCTDQNLDRAEEISLPEGITILQDFGQGMGGFFITKRLSFEEFSSEERRAIEAIAKEIIRSLDKNQDALRIRTISFQRREKNGRKTRRTKLNCFITNQPQDPLFHSRK